MWSIQFSFAEGVKSKGERRLRRIGKLKTKETHVVSEGLNCSGGIKYTFLPPYYKFNLVPPYSWYRPHWLGCCMQSYHVKFWVNDIKAFLEGSFVINGHMKYSFRHHNYCVYLFKAWLMDLLLLNCEQILTMLLLDVTQIFFNAILAIFIVVELI